ncbi:MAG: MBOAT family protein [Chitinivibrionales bacterium]|nr:MBOAT family protein [Chitinivibrionales bacterium]
MLFNSFQFAILCSITFILYYIPALRKIQIPILIAASFVFYAYTQIYLLLLLVSSILINVTASYLVVHGDNRFRKTFAIVGVCVNLGTLLFFKYSPLVSLTFFDVSRGVGHFLAQIPLPVGISFFTFQGISLVIDVFREPKVESYKSLIANSFSRHLFETAFFISFFSQLVAGPIVRAHYFYTQIQEKRLSGISWEYCFRKLVLGYFLKMVIADNLKDQTFWISFPYFLSHSSLTLITMLFGYSCQIFADFAGYSLIALGLAGLFGYCFEENFQFPYISRSFSEFWRRWHISLSTFLRQYLYIPLGGNRKGKVRTYSNLMATMLLGGLWHGAAWSYMIWGGAHGLALAAERFIKDHIRISDTIWFSAMRIFFVFCYVTTAWLLFKLPNFDQTVQFVIALFNNRSRQNSYSIISSVLLFSLPVVAYHLRYLISNTQWFKLMVRIDSIIYGILLFLIVTNSGIAGEFIYFQF